MNKKTILDANAVLRYLLTDVEEQYLSVKKIIEHNLCTVPLEVMAEVVYVLEGVYQVPRPETASSLKELTKDLIITDSDVFLRALDEYALYPKLDFVDCLMVGYKLSRNADIVTFDQRLLKRLKNVFL